MYLTMIDMAPLCILMHPKANDAAFFVKFG